MNEFRDILFSEIHRLASMDKRVMVLPAEMGALELDRIKEDFKEQFVNVGIAEQSGIDIAAGLALEGKIIFFYGITPFVTLRCLEQIKVDLCTMKLPVTIIGVGAGFAYGADGPTHHSIEEVAVLRALPEMIIFSPSDPISVRELVRIAYATPGPKYIRLDKGSYPIINKQDHDFSLGLSIHGSRNTARLDGRLDVTIISTGTLVHKALAVSEELAEQYIFSNVVDLYRIKPINESLLLRAMENSKLVVTLEEHSIIGGIGSAVSEVLSDNHVFVPLKRIGVKDKYSFKYGTPEWLHQLHGLDAESVKKTILEELK